MRYLVEHSDTFGEGCIPKNILAPIFPGDHIEDRRVFKVSCHVDFLGCLRIIDLLFLDHERLYSIQQLNAFKQAVRNAIMFLVEDFIVAFLDLLEQASHAAAVGDSSI